jgi:hypothetical protein
MPPPETGVPEMSEFEKLLVDILAHELDETPDDDTIEQLRKILAEDGMDSDEEVPDWIMMLFESLRSREPIEVHDQPDPSTEAEIDEFFTDLEDIAAFDTYDHGEWVRIRLPRHGMLGFFSRQFAFFSTYRLDDVSDDGLSDVSDAKMYERPEAADARGVET